MPQRERVRLTLGRLTRRRRPTSSYRVWVVKNPSLSSAVPPSLFRLFPLSRRMLCSARAPLAIAPGASTSVRRRAERSGSGARVAAITTRTRTMPSAQSSSSPRYHKLRRDRGDNVIFSSSGGGGGGGGRGGGHRGSSASAVLRATAGDEAGGCADRSNPLKPLKSAQTRSNNPLNRRLTTHHRLQAPGFIQPSNLCSEIKPGFKVRFRMGQLVPATTRSSRRQ